MGNPCKKCLKRPMCHSSCDNLQSHLYNSKEIIYILITLFLIFINLLPTTLTRFSWWMLSPIVPSYFLFLIKVFKEPDSFKKELNSWQKIISIIFAGYMYLTVEIADTFDLDNKIKNHIFRFVKEK